ncbi:class I SAM-dependent methyltransferase [Pantoea dispersa]|uniref:class I SAM-dependent methyltransferase n=1 Tax=Pantoea dispersa TaxID=59814 RepID=UPI0021B001A9|nr:class I SAM-dependent methyltransferase [Pantoea dispersa]MCT6589198.1 class I SAM-dependent methyltransferase [Pantoea dispersa]
MKEFYQKVDSELVFFPELGIGRYPVPQERPYDARYFQRYQQMAETETGRQLTVSRIELIARHYHGPVLDVGIGAGQFVSMRPFTSGYDVNPAGVEWLKEKGLYVDLYSTVSPAISMWDVLEHIDDPEAAVARAGEIVFVSIPIFRDSADILQSHHFRKDEHIWYFTDEGLRNWFRTQGFQCVEHNRMECELGRQGIGTYAFRRIK